METKGSGGQRALSPLLSLGNLKMQIAFTGHRDRVTDIRFLESIHQEFPGAIWVNGGARGFDTQVSNYADRNGVEYREFLPRYDLYSGKAAPLRRNEEMLDWNGGANLVVACWDGRRSGGTWHCINEAWNRGIPVRIVRASSLY